MQASPVVQSPNEAQSQAFPFWRVLAVVGLAGATVAVCLWASPVTEKSEAGIVMHLPGSIGGLWGTDLPVSESEKVILPTDTEFAKKLYSDGLGNDIQCQVVLAGAEKRSIHRPEICLPSQGWTVKSGEVHPVKLANGASLDVMQLTVVRPVMLNNGQQRELTTLFCYWFVGKDTTTPHHIARVIKTNIDMLLHNINHRWAYVIVSTPVLQGFVPGGKNLEQTTAHLDAFSAALAPQIMPAGILAKP
jgi:hypothetical protein